MERRSSQFSGNFYSFLSDYFLAKKNSQLAAKALYTNDHSAVGCKNVSHETFALSKRKFRTGRPSWTGVQAL